jgi:PAS domain S-box-containing protein/putative nucleotidyltransferase with HDIG domain
VEKVKQIPNHEEYRGERMLLALSKVSQALQSTRSPEDVYLKFTESIHELGFEATILSLDDSGTYLTTAYQAREPKRMKRFSKMIGFSINDFRVPIRRDGILDQVVNSGRTVFLESRTEIFLEIFPKGFRSLISRMVEKDGKQMKSIIAPLRFEEKTFGVIGVSSVELGENDMAAITVFAGQVSAALMNARAYLALQEQEKEKFRIIFDSAPDAYYLSDLKGKFVDGNKQAERMTGYSKEELIGKSFLTLNLLSKSQLLKAADLLAKNALGKSTGPNEFTLIRKDGGEIEVEISTHPVQIEGKLVVLGIARDITERKQAEQALIDSEYLLRESQEIALLGSYILDIPSGYWESSQILDDLFGIDEKYTKDIANWATIIHPDDRAMMQEYFATNVLKNQESFNKEYRIQRINDQQVLWVHGLGKLEISDDGIPIKMIGTIQDITERKQTEAALKDSESKYRNLVESSPDGIITLSKTGQVLSVNESFSKLTGFEKSDFVGKSFLKAPTLLKQDRDFFTRLVKDVFQGKIKGTIEFNWKHANGEIRNGEAKASFLKVEDKIVGIQGIIRDITERKQNEEKQRAIEERYRAVVENSLNGIIIVDEDFKLEYVNDPLCQVLGRSHEEIIGHDFREFLDEESEKLVRDRYLRRQRGEEITARYEFNVLRKDGEPRRVEISSAIVRDPKGKVRTIAQIVDITERKKAEGTLKRQLGELLILQEVSSICLENVDEHQIITQITKTIGNELYTDHFGVMLLDEEDNVLRIHPSYQGLVPEDADFEIKLGEGVVGRVAKTNKPLRINDVTEEENYISPKHCQASELCVPISVNSKVFGVINAESSKPDAFTSEDERLLITVADQLAVALQKSRLYYSEQKRRLEAEANREASSFLTMSLDLDEVLDNILDSLRKVIDSDQASIHLFEEDLVHVVAGKGFKNIDEVIGYKYSFENQLVLEIVNSKSPLVLEDTALDSRFQHYGPENPRAWMGIPLIERETVFGYISVENNIPGTFNQRDAKLIQIFANNAAAAIVKARLFEGEKKRRLEAEIQGEISTALTDTYNLKTFLEKVLRNLQRYLNYDSAGILLEEDGHIRIVATLGFPEPDKINNLCISKDNQLYQEILKTKSVLILKDTEQDDRFEDIGAEVDIRGWMGIPLIDQGVVYGYMSFDSKTPGKFTPEMGRLAQVLVNQTSSAIIKTKLFEETQLGLKRLEALHEIDRIITSSVELSFSIKQILQIVVSQLEIDAASLLLYDPKSLMFNTVNTVGLHNNSHNQNNHQVGIGPAAKVALERQIVVINNQDEFKNLFSNASSLIKEGFTAYAGVPLIAKGEIKGVLELFQRSSLQTNNEWKGFLQTLANQLAIAIDNSQMFENLQKSHMELTLSYDATIEGWAKTLELKDQETQGHSERVTLMTVKLARELGMSEEELIHVRRGAILHDVGKIGIPDKILQKPGQLTEDEMAVMREHPTLAYNVLSESVFLEKALDIPYSHHEKWDGTGYPRGIKEMEIPLAARVFAIIDVYDALRSNRPYRKAWSKRKTVKYINEQSGIHFDPRVVEVFLELVDTDPGFIVYD